jgi:hypothetical protein
MDNTAIITTTQEGNAKNMTPKKTVKTNKNHQVDQKQFNFYICFTVHCPSPSAKAFGSANKQRHGKH